LPLFFNFVFYCGVKPWKGPKPISGYQERINLFFNRIYDTIDTEFINLATLDYTYLSDSIKDRYYDGQIVKDEPIFRAGLIAMKAASCNLIVEKLPSIILTVTACHEDPIFQPAMEALYKYTQAAASRNLRQEVGDRFIQLTVEFMAEYRKPEKDTNDMKTFAEALVEKYGSRLISEATAKAEAEARAKVEAETRAKVEAETRAKEAEAIILLLKLRHGTVPKTLEKKIFKESNIDKFNNLVVFASKCLSLQEFSDYLMIT
jgi:hypothetical protein